MAAPVLELSQLDGTDGLVVRGVAEGDASGHAVYSAGDINFDGIDDILIGAPFADPGGRAEAGTAYVVYGSARTGAPFIDLSALDGANGFDIEGQEAGDTLGFAVSATYNRRSDDRVFFALADANEDRIDDIVIGAPGADPGARDGAGRTYVVYGQEGGFGNSFDLSTLDGQNGFVLDGDTAGASSGAAVGSGVSTDSPMVVSISGARIGEMHVLVGAPDLPGPAGVESAGGFYVVMDRGDSPPTVIDIGESRVANGNGSTAFERSGNSIAGLGDFFQTTLGDIAVGVPGYDQTGREDAGLVLVVHSGAAPLTNALFFVGEAAGDMAGFSVETAGDVNRDLRDDLIIGAPGSGPDGTGAAYVVFGTDMPTDFSMQFVNLGELDETQGFKIIGIAPGDETGYSVASAGDFNRDGFDDLLIGAPGANGGAGVTYLVYGTREGYAGGVVDLRTLDELTGLVFEGNAIGDRSGSAVAGAQDFDRDGFNDILIGAPGAAGGAGETYIVYGYDSFIPRITAGQSFAYSENLRAGDIVVGRSFQEETAHAVTEKAAIEIRENIGIARVDIIAGDEDGFFAADRFGRILLTEAGAASAANDFETGQNSFSLTVTATDTAGNVSAPQTVTLTVSDAAAVQDDTFEIGRDGTVSAAPSLGGDTARAVGIGAINGQTVTPGEVVALPSSATVRVNDDGTLTYDLDGASVSGTDSFTYAARLGTDLFDPAEVDGETGVILAGVIRGDRTGFVVSSAGDLNGDGFDDVMVSGEFSGEVYLIFGSENGFPALLDLATLDGSNGFTIDSIGEALIPNGFGIPSGEVSVAPAGDLNNDGIDDIVIGRAFLRTEARDDVLGATFVVFGTEDGFGARLDASTLDGSDGFQIRGVSQQLLGAVVSGGGDVNGDGIDDILIGEGSYLDPGASTVLFGREDGFPASLGTADIGQGNGFRIDGARNAVIVGDINDDGLADIFVPTFRSVFDEVTPAFVMFGSDTGFPDTLDADDIDESNGFVLAGADFSGQTSIADVNGDGIDDLIVGTTDVDYLERPDDELSFPSAHVVYGTRNGFGSEVDVTTMEASVGVSIDGIEASFGEIVVSGIEDFNGDGVDDLAFGSPGADPLPGDAANGLVTLIFGRVGGLDDDLDVRSLGPGEGLRLPGIDALDYAGTAISSAGDVNNDGYGDLLLGAPRGLNTGSRFEAPGEAIIVFGRPDISAHELSDEATVTVAIDLTRIGGAGNDTLTGGPGSDTLLGGGGNDLLIGGTAPDDPGDSIEAGDGNDTVIAGAGDDTINGGFGFDSIDGGEGDDIVTGLSGFDTIDGGAGADTLRGNAGNDVLYGGGDDDLLEGGIGFDVMSGDAGNDSLIAGAGFDTLNGGTGDDTLLGNAGNDSLQGGDGDDRLEGGIMADTLEGGAGNDLLLGGNGGDTLLGGVGDDRLHGNAGADRLDGGAGNDVLVGGIGADTFVFGLSYGADRVADFQNNIDAIHLDAALLGGGAPVAADLIQYAGRTEDGFLILDFGGGDTLTFTGVTNTGAILDEVTFI